MDGGCARRQGQGQSLDAVPRKPSFKCGGPGTRVTYRSVRALTNQFDLMSGQTRPRLKSKPSENAAISEQSCLAVRTAINIFEKASPPTTARPVAAVKPICKTVQPKPSSKPKPKLVPKDSLCRARYNDMRRSSKVAEVKLSKSDAAEQTGETDMIKLNNCDKNKEQSETLDPNVANWEERAPYTVQLRKQLSEKSLEALKDRLGKENISIQTPPKENMIDTNQTHNNYSSVFNQISQTRINRIDTKNKKERTFAALLKKEQTNEQPMQLEEQQVKTPTENIKPNMSFLWSAKSQTELCESIKDKSPTINDTPLPKPPESFFPDCFYESISGRSEETDIYDDIGGPSAANGSSSLYYISDELDLFNIYEDIGSANIYESGEELKNGLASPTSDSQVYEHVCEEAIYGDAVYHSICGESVQSSYEKNNSLYESADPATITGIGTLTF